MVVLLLLLGILFAVALVMGCTAQRGTLRQVGGNEPPASPPHVPLEPSPSFMQARRDNAILNRPGRADGFGGLLVGGWLL